LTDRTGPELDRERITALLGLLDARLRNRGESATLYVVGGAAVAATVADRRVTQDVDVAWLDAAVAEEARAIAAAERLPDTWLNASAAPWVPARPSAVSRLAEGPQAQDLRSGLTVVYAPAEHLLAMKMLALRVLDAPDIVALAAHLDLSGAPPPRFEQILRSAYPREGELAQMLGVAEDDAEAEVRGISQRVATLVARRAGRD
jgi:hypothetical protein